MTSRTNIYLFHFTPPVDFEEEPTLLVADSEGGVEKWTLEELSEHSGPLVTHSFSLLVDWFRQRGLPLPSQVVDMELSAKLITGRPKSDYKVVKPWDMPSVLKSILPSDRDERQLRAAMVTHLSKPNFSELGNLRWMTAVARSLPSLWQTTVSTLKEKGEYNRFFDEEVPAYNAMLATQYRGIHVDEALCAKFLDEVDQEYQRAHFALTITMGVDVERALTDAEYLISILGLSPSSFNEPPFVQDLIASKKDSDDTCRLLDVVLKSRRNKGILLRCFGVEQSMTYPVFETMGTVTGRIMAIDPQLQHLSKPYRKIIQAAAGHRLGYVDFSQFEPSIMAAITNDPNLLDLAKENDLYTKLSIEIFGSDAHRKACKLMFLAYSYGKPLSTLSDLVRDLFTSKELADAAISAKFAPLFEGIEKWKSSVQDALQREGKIGTTHGNFRYRAKDGNLGPKEKRWAVSQVVQGTGSVILKRLINRTTKELPEVNVLLPMHDALLVEVPEEKADALLAALVELCKSAFLEICPSVQPKISQEPFAGA